MFSAFVFLTPKDFILSGFQSFDTMNVILKARRRERENI